MMQLRSRAGSPVLSRDQFRMQKYGCKGRSREAPQPHFFICLVLRALLSEASLRAPKHPLSTRCPADHTCQVIFSAKRDHGHSSTPICWLLMSEGPLQIDLSLTNRHNLRFHSVGCSVFKTEAKSQEGLWNPQYWGKKVPSLPHPSFKIKTADLPTKVKEVHQKSDFLISTTLCLY